MSSKKCLLVEPKPTKSWGVNNQHVGLLRVGNWLQSTGNKVQYVVAPDIPEFQPDEIYATSMFTYDWESVRDAISQYRFLYPKAIIHLGGIYATLCPEHAEGIGADTVTIGRHERAKDYPPDPSLLPTKAKYAYLFTSYGCDKACTYCATHLLFGRGIEQSPVGKVVDEIKFLADKGFKRIRFGDDNILHNAENHIMPICESIIEAGIKANFEVPGGMTAMQLTPDVLSLMRMARFNQFSFAIESTSSSVRRKMGRAAHTGEEDLIRAIELCDKSGIPRRAINVYFIIGLPYQTIPDMMGTLIFLLSLGVWAFPTRLTPIPGTVDWKRMGLEDWSLESLHYKQFVAPGQDEFTGDDLNDIYRIARIFNVGSRMAGNKNWLQEKSKVYDLFRKEIKEIL